MKTADGKIVDYSRIFALVGDWFALEMKTLWRTHVQHHQGGLLMGCPLWGEKYIRNFDRYCLASMLSGANREALARWGCTLAIFTDNGSMQAIHGLKGPLRDKGIELLIFEIPPDIMAEIPKDPMNRYWVLGPVHQFLMKAAGWWGLGYHMLLPDHVFGEHYFPSLWELSQTYSAIAQTGLSADTAPAAKEIDAYRNPDGSIAIPDRDLGDIGLRHLHAQMQPMILNGKNLDGELPVTTWLAWKGKDAVHIYSAHLNAAYLSPEICVEAPTRIPATLDAELPAFLGNQGVYIPEAKDGMTFIELSDEEKADYPEQLSADNFAMQCWTRLKWDERYLPLFRARGEIPVHHQPDGLELDYIESQQGMVLDRLKAGQERAALNFIHKMAQV